MEKVFVWMFVFVLTVNGVFSATDGWADINNDDGGGTVPASGGASDDSAASVSGGSVVGQDGEGKSFFTTDFYIALGLIVLILAIIALFVWLFVRGPRNKWE